MTASLLPYAPERDVYRLLQVEPSANDHEIAAACRRLALAFHPDYNRSPRAHEEMQIVNAVRNLLTDPRSRAAYDGARRHFLYHRERSWQRARGVVSLRPITPRTVVARPEAPSPEAPIVVEPFEPRTRWMGLLHRRARRAALAVLAAVRGAMAMGPTHCSNCQERVEPTDRYCAWCGIWVGRTERLSGT